MTSDRPLVPDEETRLKIAHYRSEFQRIATRAANCALSNSTDVEDWRAEMQDLVDRAQRFINT